MTLKRFGDATVIADMVVHNGVAYLAGHVAEDPISPSVYEQTKNILKQIDETLAQAKTDKTQTAADQYLALRHLHLRRDESRLEGMGPSRSGPGPRHRGGQAGRPEVEGRDHGHGRLRLNRFGFGGAPCPSNNRPNIQLDGSRELK